MKRPKMSERLFLEELFDCSKNALEKARGVNVGQLITLIRQQVGMSQRALAKKAEMTQSTIARAESSDHKTNLSTLKKILDALECDLVISVTPRGDLDSIRKKQAHIKAERKIEYLHGTMSLEKQSPSSLLLRKLVEEEENRLLDSTGSELWEDDL